MQKLRHQNLFDPLLFDFQNPNSVEFLKGVNPLGKIPVVVDGDFVITESRAIIKWVTCNSH